MVHLDHSAVSLENLSRLASASGERESPSAPGSAWGRSVLEAPPPLLPWREAEPRGQCAPRQSLGARGQAGRLQHGSHTSVTAMEAVSTAELKADAPPTSVMSACPPLPPAVWSQARKVTPGSTTPA